jgi:hypothetical protein
MNTTRNIATYLPPDRATRSDHADDTHAFKEALAAGPGIVHIPAGHFRVAAITVPTGVTLQGSGDGTLLLPAPNHHGPVILQENAHSFAIKDLAIQSAPHIQPTVPSPTHSHGILIRRCHHYRINAVTTRGFAFAGIEITRTPLGLADAAFCDGGMLSQITSSDNAIGILFNTRGEYTVLSDSSLLRNQTGTIIHAGNCRLNACSISGNHDGIWIVDHENGSHGIISNCLINHNTRYALLARDMPNGMLINSCCFFYGAILAQRTQGLVISNCELDAPVTFEQGKNNAFLNNNHIHAWAGKPKIQLEPDTRT